ncbi:Gfo/Idh/MocA family protein [Jiangella asiatica]|uniref:Gfo/Idh/MocA family oxidoreductase n=1 Tax=Jiangella asiatica TaxID=2530372 RepID=A0A4R5D9C1_9ACTN|nr:Gfo/Idh/MocA family oxidoreductase [Jiangella asiatica]TDE08004.1 Gfo/Idh/MocA family oxidoreductase [Jiangella asiatica]
MTGPDGVDVAVVGLRFGEQFLPIYLSHPHVRSVAIVDTSADRLREVGDRHGVRHRYRSFDDVLADERWQAVHILTPVALHADYALAALAAGKHCACAVPMATELADLEAIVAAQRRTGTVYMMMETAVFGREYLLADQLRRTGRLGELILYRGYHVQNLDGHPEYWRGYPPMKYSTHALSPALALTGRTVAEVTAYGSGRLTDDRLGEKGNPYPAEVGLFRLRDSDLVAQVTVSFFQTARPTVEGFSVYGDRGSFEWSGAEGDPVMLFEETSTATGGSDGRRHGTDLAVTQLYAPDRDDRLPAEVTPYLRPHQLVPHDGGGPVVVPAAHGGSHPHLVHEFVSSIVEHRPPAVDTATAAAWTAPGICAHESALAGGKPVQVPSYA